jgi:hypothetical protein
MYFGEKVEGKKKAKLTVILELPERFSRDI